MPFKTTTLPSMFAVILLQAGENQVLNSRISKDLNESYLCEPLCVVYFSHFLQISNEIVHKIYRYILKDIERRSLSDRFDGLKVNDHHRILFYFMSDVARCRTRQNSSSRQSMSQLKLKSRLNVKTSYVKNIMKINIIDTSSTLFEDLANVSFCPPFRCVIWIRESLKNIYFFCASRNRDDPEENERDENVNYWPKFNKFHSTPAVKMIYHFVSYININFSFNLISFEYHFSSFAYFFYSHSATWWCFIWNLKMKKSTGQKVMWL